MEGQQPMNTRHDTAKTTLVATWASEIAASREARRTGDRAAAWHHLERAHIISQPLAGRHVRTHLAMMRFALGTADLHEIVGQLFRIVVAVPGSLTGRYPAGNTGGANVSAFEPMPIPADLTTILRTGTGRA
jgi:hypothetical protein